METKQCKDCKAVKSIDNFPTYKTTKKSGEVVIHLECRCKKCFNLKKYQQKTNTPEKLALYKLKCKIRRAKNSAENPEREKLKAKDYWQKVKKEGKFKEKWLWNKYKLLHKDYIHLLIIQDYKCAICSVAEKDLPKPLYVDHCHITGKVRGLLCASCNFSLGGFRDNIELLQKAILYLEKQ